MLPRVIAYNRNNYARHMSVYWCEMVLLPQTHPYSNALLVDGQFAVQRSAFAQVPVDHTIERTMNRDSKTNGGIVGISLNRGAVQSWNVTAHDRWTSCKPAEKWRVCMMLPVSSVERGSSVGRMPDSQSREPGFESPLLPFRSLGIFFHFTTPQSTQLYK